MKMKRSTLALLALLTSVSVAAAALAAPKGSPFRAVWGAIAELQDQANGISLIPGAQGPPGPQGPRGPSGVREDGNLVVAKLAVGEDSFSYNSTIDPRIIVHDESREATTIAFFKYSNG